MFIDTSKLNHDLRVYLELFTELLFELPIKNSQVDLTHEEAVGELNRDLLEFESSIGIHGRKFSPGIFSQYLCVTTKCPLEYYHLAVKWLKYVVFDSVFSNKQIKTTVLNLLKDLKDYKQQPKKLMRPLLNDIFFKKGSFKNDAIMCPSTSNLIIKQGKCKIIKKSKEIRVFH